MNIAASTLSPSHIANLTAQEALAAQQAIGADAKAENGRQIAALTA